MTASIFREIPLLRNGKSSVWKGGKDSNGGPDQRTLSLEMDKCKAGEGVNLGRETASQFPENSRGKSATFLRSDGRRQFYRE